MIKAAYQHNMLADRHLTFPPACAHTLRVLYTPSFSLYFIFVSVCFFLHLSFMINIIRMYPHILTFCFLFTFIWSLNVNFCPLSRARLRLVPPFLLHPLSLDTALPPTLLFLPLLSDISRSLPPFLSLPLSLLYLPKSVSG